MQSRTKSERHSRRLRDLAATAALDSGHLLRRTSEAVEALARIEAGTYGVCRDCDNRIPVARLRAKPEATRCIRCQLAFEHGRAA